MSTIDFKIVLVIAAVLLLLTGCGLTHARGRQPVHSWISFSFCEFV
ncbi:hypothetical protein [Photorhabdus asymbiotica]